jgi:hypothetical protein
MNEQQNPSGPEPMKIHSDRLALYHPNSAGNGAALQLEPRVNRKGTDRYNCFFLELAPQKTAARGEGGTRTAATFDWGRKLTVKLGFSDICEILAVLEGRADKAGGQRNGLYHETGRGNTLITFQRNPDKGGCFVGLSQKIRESGQTARIHMALTECEAIGLRCLFQVGLFFVTFPGSMSAGWARRAEALPAGV